MRKSKQKAIVLSLTGGAEVGKMTTSHLLIELIKHSFFIMSTTTREYPEGDPRKKLYDSIEEHLFTAMRFLNQLAFWVIHTGVSKIPARYGISTEVIDNLLASDGTVGITALGFESVVGLRQYLAPDQLVQHLPIYLCAPEEAVHRRRLLRKHLAKDAIDKEIEAAKRMEKRAREATHIPFVFIDSNPSARVVALEILSALKKHRHTYHV